MNRHVILGFLLGAAVVSAIVAVVRWERPATQPIAHEQHSKQTTPAVRDHQGNSAKNSDLDAQPSVREVDHDMAIMKDDMHAPVHSHHGNSAKKSDLAAHPYVREMDRDMAKMMADMHAPGYSGQWDADFLAMMIPHHQGAIDMAKLVLVHGNDPLTRELAVEIIASQQAEIEAMKARLAILRLKPGERASQEFPSLSGTRGAKN